MSAQPAAPTVTSESTGETAAAAKSSHGTAAAVPSQKDSTWQLVSKLLATGKAARAEKKKQKDGEVADSETAVAESAADAGKKAGVRATWKRLLALVKPESVPVGISVGTLAVTTGISLVFPYAIGEILDVALKPDAALSLSQLGGGLLGLFVVQSVLIAVRSALLSISGERIAAGLRKDLFRSIVSQEVGWFDRQRTGDIITRLSADVSVIQKSLTTNVANGLKSTAMFAGCVGMLFYLSPSLALLSLGLIPPVAVAGMKYGQFVEGQQKAVQEAIASATSVGEEVVSSIRTVRQFGREPQELARFADRVAESFSLSRRIAIVSAWFDGAMHMAANASLVAVLWYGGSLVFSGAMSAGELTSFLMYSLYSGFNIASLSGIYTDIKRASGAAGRIFEITDRTPAMPLAASPDVWSAATAAAAAQGVLVSSVPSAGAVVTTPSSAPLSASASSSSSSSAASSQLNASSASATAASSSASASAIDPSLRTLDRVSGHIGFKDVTFAYPTRPTAPILQNFSLSVPAGKNVVLVGGSGTGKSTVGALLTRLYDPQQGSVTIDGVDVRELDPTWLRRFVVGTVGQEPVLFASSVADNIRFGKPDATDAEVEEAARMANIHEAILRLPQGYETLVGERGVQLSGGQRQRVAIARACIKSSPIMLLDESTSALDAESEAAVMAALDNVSKGRTVISIAHRLSTMKHADLVAVLAGGRVAEVGPFDELFANKASAFRQLIDRQTVV